MKLTWMKVTMIMLLGVLVAGSLGGTHYAAAQNSPGVDKALAAAENANSKVLTTWGQMMTKMDAMNKMPMTANEKAMMVTEAEFDRIVDPRKMVRPYVAAAE